ncbi:MAG: DUF2062 domain-containing protein [Alphaproteobacteria bacterium]
MRKLTLWQKIKRVCRYRLVIPLVRSPHPPKYKALGVSIGVAWAMTPLVGIQMYLVFLTWLVMKKIFKRDFSLVLGLAYTWITNVFTMIPIYYGFYVTGQLMMRRPITGYVDLKETMKGVFFADYTFWEKIMASGKLLMQDWGLGMSVGCLPWALVFGVGSYYMTMRYERLRLKLKQKRLAERQK